MNYFYLYVDSFLPILELLSTHLDVAVLGGQVKRCSTLVGASVDVGSVADQQGSQRRVAV